MLKHMECNGVQWGSEQQLHVQLLYYADMWVLLGARVYAMFHAVWKVEKGLFVDITSLPGSSNKAMGWDSVHWQKKLSKQKECTCDNIDWAVQV